MPHATPLLRRLLLAAAAAAVPCLVACLAADSQGEERFPRDDSYATPAVPAADPAEFAAAIRAQAPAQRTRLAAADVVFRGRILAVGKSPGIASGILHVTQPVLYEVREIVHASSAAFRGDAFRSVVVHHTVLRSPPGDPKVSPRIDPALFREGAELLVAAILGPANGGRDCTHMGHLRFVEETAAPSTPDVRAALDEALSR